MKTKSSEMAKIWLFWLQQGQFQYLKCQFFSRILIIMEIRLKFQSTGHLTLSNMSKLIPHCSNHQKIFFWPWSGVKWGKIFKYSNIYIFVWPLMGIYEKNWHLKYWNWPRCNQNSQILASVWVLKILQMSCAKPYTNNN